MKVEHVFASLFTLAVIFGLMIMVLNRPQPTNALLAAGASTIGGVTKSLEGR